MAVLVSASPLRRFMDSAKIPARTNPQREGLCTKEIYMLDSRGFGGSRWKERVMQGHIGNIWQKQELSPV